MKKFINIYTVLLISIFGLILHNLFYLTTHTASLLTTPAKLHEPGFQFKPFQKKLKNAQTIGYLTNKDLTWENQDGFFQQAQYLLAPAIIHLNDPQHRFLILDYTDPVFTIYKLKELNYERIAENDYGQILAEKKTK